MPEGLVAMWACAPCGKYASAFRAYLAYAQTSSSTLDPAPLPVRAVLAVARPFKAQPIVIMDPSARGPYAPMDRASFVSLDISG